MNFSAERYITLRFASWRRICPAIACIRCVLPSPTPPYRNSGLKGAAGKSAMRLAAANASSFGCPTTKFSNVQRGSSGAPTSPRGAVPLISGRSGCRLGKCHSHGNPGWRRQRHHWQRRRRQRRHIERHAVDLGVDAPPEHANAVGVMGRDPIAQEARGYDEQDALALEATQRQGRQPGAICRLAEFRAQHVSGPGTTAHPDRARRSSIGGSSGPQTHHGLRSCPYSKPCASQRRIGLSLNTDAPTRLQNQRRPALGGAVTIEPATYAHDDTPGGAAIQGDRKENARYRAMVERLWKIFS